MLWHYGDMERETGGVWRRERVRRVSPGCAKLSGYICIQHIESLAVWSFLWYDGIGETACLWVSECTSVRVFVYHTEWLICTGVSLYKQCVKEKLCVKFYKASCVSVYSDSIWCLKRNTTHTHTHKHTHTLGYLMLLRVLIARRVFFKEWIVRRGDLSVNTLSLPLSPSLHLSPSLPASLPPSLCPLRVSQCKIWTQRPYKSGWEIMRVGPLSPVGHQPGLGANDIILRESEWIDECDDTVPLLLNQTHTHTYMYTLPPLSQVLAHEKGCVCVCVCVVLGAAGVEGHWIWL